MPSFNSVTLMGRMVSDPETRVAGNSGSSVTKFRLGVGRGKKNPQTGQWESGPDQIYIDCEAWSRPDQKRNLGDVVTRFGGKGKEVLVHGELREDQWEDKSGGGKRSKIKVEVREIQFCGGRDQQDEPQPQQAQQGYGQRTGGYDAPADAGDAHGDGIPF